MKIVLHQDPSKIYGKLISASGNATINGKKIAIHNDVYQGTSNNWHIISTSSIKLNGVSISLENDYITTTTDIAGSSSSATVS